MKQLSIILKAIEMDFYVITVDNLPNNIGHQFSHQSANCSTVDLDGVCKVAEELGIDGIVTFASDITTITVKKLKHFITVNIIGKAINEFC